LELPVSQSKTGALVRRVLGLLLVCMLAARPVDAQSAWRWSIQVSGIAQKFTESGGGSSFETPPPWALGGELQARLTPGQFSIGAGLQYSHISESRYGEVTVIGPFVEPRVVLGLFGESAAPYAALRIGLLRFEFDPSYGAVWNKYVNGGGGLLLKLNRRSNLDIGATAGIDDSGSPDVVLRVGFSFGLK
jgi:hypothetical protein